MKYRYREPHEMKDSGVEWLGMIPREWGVKKLKYLSKISNGKDQKEVIDENGIYPILGSGGIFGKSNKFLYNKPSVLLGRKGTIDKPRYIEEPFWVVDTSFYTEISSKINDKLFYYLCTTIKFDLYSNSTAVPSMTQGDLNEVPFALVESKTIQQKIADFLDLKCGEFDSIIEKKESLITKLEEAKKSLISEVVTGKVKVIEKENGSYEIGKREPHEMKDSGVEWLGMIPREWEVKKVKYLSHITTGGRDTQDRIEEGIYPFFVRSPIIERINSYSFDGEAILMAGDGVGAGKVFHYYNGKFDFHQRVYKFSKFKLVSGKILHYYLKENFYKEIEKGSAKTTVDSLRLPMISNFPVSFINNNQDQQKIANFLDLKCSQFDSTIEKQKELIEKLKKAKQSLISEAVTGKIEVLTNIS